MAQKRPREEAFECDFDLVADEDEPEAKRIRLSFEELGNSIANIVYPNEFLDATIYQQEALTAMVPVTEQDTGANMISLYDLVPALGEPTPAPVLSVPNITILLSPSVDTNGRRILDCSNCGMQVKPESISKLKACPNCNLHAMPTQTLATTNMFRIVAFCEYGHLCNQTTLKRSGNAVRKCCYVNCNGKLQLSCKHCDKIHSYQVLTKSDHHCFHPYRHK